MTKKKRAPVLKKKSADTLQPIVHDDVHELIGGPKRKRTPSSTARLPRELRRKKGKWMQTDQETWQLIDIDRDANTYRETVTSVVTWEILLESGNRLSKHRAGQGQATRSA